MKATKFHSLALAFLLTGCNSYKRGFDDSESSGVGCKSIDQVNEMINNGSLGAIKRVGDESICANKIKPITLKIQANETINAQVNSHNNIVDYSPKSLQVTLFPYKDEQGIYHAQKQIIIPVS